MNSLLKEEINQTEGADIATIISTSNAAFEKRQKDNAAKLKLLDPKRQIKRIFPTLFCSLAFVMIYKTAECEMWGSNFTHHILLIISVVAAITGVWFLRNVAWAVIDVREEIATDKESSGQRSERITTLTTEVND